MIRFRSFLPSLLLTVTSCSGQLLTPGETDGGATDGGGATTDAAATSSSSAATDASATSSPSAAIDAALPGPLPADASVDCASACQAKAAGCGTPPSAVSAICAAVCGAGTSLQQACVQAESCSALATAFEDYGTFCGIGCDALCSAKAATCGAPAAASSEACAALCATGPTPSQVDCVLASDCRALAGAFAADGTVCGIGSTSDGG